MSERVVVTGLGVLSPNGNGVRDFELALRKGRSGIRTNEAMVEHGFACQVAGVPQGIDAIAESYFDDELLLAMNAGHRLAAIAAIRAHRKISRGLPQDLAISLERALEKTTGPLRLEVIAALGEAGRSEALPLLQGLLLAASDPAEAQALRQAIASLERRTAPR